MSRYFILYHLRTLSFVVVVATAVFAVKISDDHNSARIARSSQADSAKIARSSQAAAARLVKTQLQACERGNVLRASVNNDTKIIRYFMNLAARATRAKPGAGAKDRASLYSGFAASLSLAPIVDCSKVVH